MSKPDSLGLHRIENTSHSERAISLHLYCPPFNACTMFDQRTGHRTKCNVTFWSKYGEKTKYVSRLSLDTEICKIKTRTCHSYNSKWD